VFNFTEKRRMKRPLLTVILLAVGLALSLLAFGSAAAQEPTQRQDFGLSMLAAGLAIGLTGLGAALGMGTAGTAAVGAIAERPEVFSKTLIYIVFIEAIAIYGLVVAFMILIKIP
jgi:V/A-type H+-transporting ATPase subunit K